MKSLQPQIKAIQERYGGDQERIQLETARLYKLAGINPLAGVGGAIRREPRRRGAARQRFTDAQAEERIQKVLEEAQLAKDEAQRATDEAQRAKEEWLRAREEIMDRLQALEAGAAAI